MFTELAPDRTRAFAMSPGLLHISSNMVFLPNRIVICLLDRWKRHQWFEQSRSMHWSCLRSFPGHTRSRAMRIIKIWSNHNSWFFESFDLLFLQTVNILLLLLNSLFECLFRRTNRFLEWHLFESGFPGLWSESWGHILEVQSSWLILRLQSHLLWNELIIVSEINLVVLMACVL